ncbi:uncharacterized protein LOC117118551 isoform X2 [Anneissia japonica]|uniref:uncharacterized protein LOC117118551 isoform X2 n=1 Tax=Anneissia japonica TaxID=1529436 RepID=UPI00142557C8|nr:uncharacterized protein LOC117118551 isoform X2 [Anneissia japonica]
MYSKMSHSLLILLLLAGFSSKGITSAAPTAVAPNCEWFCYEILTTPVTTEAPTTLPSTTSVTTEVPTTLPPTTSVTTEVTTTTELPREVVTICRWVCLEKKTTAPTTALVTTEGSGLLVGILLGIAIGIVSTLSICIILWKTRSKSLKATKRTNNETGAKINMTFIEQTEKNQTYEDIEQHDDLSEKNQMYEDLRENEDLREKNQTYEELRDNENINGSDENFYINVKQKKEEM